MSFAPANIVGPGLRLDRYELLCLIAEGGMANVWLARMQGKHGFERLVAVKTILPKFATDPQFHTMFLDEARIASHIDHSNVARIVDLGEDHGVLYLVMEWVDGDSLSRVQRLLAHKGIALSQGVVLRLMADACAGLHAAHELRDREGRPLGVVHRDVSPQNIMVSIDGVAKVIDFGIAKAFDRVAGDTASGTLKGKIHYMPPEQALGHHLDRRADVWAIGAVLYNFFAGRPVYGGPGSEISALQRLTSGEPPPPLPAKVPEPIAHIIMGALRHDPQHRWPTADDMRRVIEKSMLDLGCATTSADVSHFVATYMPERAAARRQTIERAILAAKDRPSTPPDPPSLQSASGLMDVKARTPASLVTSYPAVEQATRARPLQPQGESSPTTLGATLDAPLVPRRGRAGLVFGAMAGIGILAAGAAALLYVLHAGPGATAGGQVVGPPRRLRPIPSTAPLLPPMPPPTGLAVPPPGWTPAATAPSAAPSASVATAKPAGRPSRPRASAGDAGAGAPKVIDDGF